MAAFKKVAVVVLLAAALLVPLSAVATPYLEIGTKEEWAAAMSQGLITPVPGNVFQQMVVEEEKWPSEYKTATFLTPELYVMDSDWQGQPGLYMTWGPGAADGQRLAAAWDLHYPEDPNLNGLVIHFSIFPPVPSTLFSLNLIDKNGNYREWIWHAGPGELPPGQWSDLWIDPVTGATNWPTFGGSPFIHDTPGQLFDLNSIQILRFDENIAGREGNLFPPGPGGPVLPFMVWNAWDHVAVNPEPATMLLLGGGLIALARRRRNRK